MVCVMIYTTPFAYVVLDRVWYNQEYINSTVLMYSWYN